MSSKWDDVMLDAFHQEFRDFAFKFSVLDEKITTHMGNESYEQKQQQELYAAVFQKEDKEANTPAGLLQMTMRVCEQLHEMRVWQDRQKTFVGGVVFTITSLWFLFTDVGPNLLSWFRKL